MYAVDIVVDTLAPHGGRLITLTAQYPRIVHAELMTHRAFARNAASSRAIPFNKMCESVMNDPFIPIRWGMEQRGMQTSFMEAHGPSCESEWLYARDKAVESARQLHELGLHKSLCNRLLEPFSWITVVITATEWANFFRLRCHDDAEIHLQHVAYMMRDAIKASTPTLRAIGEWHVPFVDDHDRKYIKDTGCGSEETDTNDLLKAGTARCARLSYLTHLGLRDLGKDFELFDKLVQGSGFGHWSPHEHVAQVLEDSEYRSGPFVGFLQYRKTFAGENVGGLGV